MVGNIDKNINNVTIRIIEKETKMNKVIYYFTGTGNSMRAAEKVAKHLKNTEIVSMRNNPEDVPAIDANIIGFIYPVYHWTMPKPVVEFIHKLLINPNAYIFVITMPSFINGYACEKLEELIKIKNAKIAYGTKVYSVANYVIAYSPIPPPKWIVPRTEKKLDKIGNDIANKKEKEIPRPSGIVRKMYSKTMHKYQELLSFADYGFFMNKHCTLCGLCVKLCPCHNIEMIEGKHIFNHICTHCMACVCFCPKRAIEYKLPDNYLEYLSNNLLDVAVIKKMSLPPNRKIYHNPFVTSADIVKNNKTIIE